jgi:hypothetical protein
MTHRDKIFQKLFLYCILLIYLVFTGLRNEVGPDWDGYVYLYEIYSIMRTNDIISIPEPGFFLLIQISEALGLGINGVIFLSSAIFLIGCFSYANTTTNPWLAIATITPYLVFVVSMSGSRQAAAIGIGLYLLSKWNHLSPTKKTALILFATTFHTSAIIYSIFMIFDRKPNSFLKLILTFTITTIAILVLETESTINRYKLVYVEKNLISGGALYHVLLTTIPAGLYILYRRKISLTGNNNYNVRVASIFSILLMALLPLSSTGVDRLVLYFSFVQMWVYPSIINSGIVRRRFGITLISTYLLLIFFVYFIFGTHAEEYIPYKNLLIDLLEKEIIEYQFGEP